MSSSSPCPPYAFVANTTFCARISPRGVHTFHPWSASSTLSTGVWANAVKLSPRHKANTASVSWAGLSVAASHSFAPYESAGNARRADSADSDFSSRYPPAAAYPSTAAAECSANSWERNTSKVDRAFHSHSMPCRLTNASTLYKPYHPTHRLNTSRSDSRIRLACSAPCSEAKCGNPRAASGLQCPAFRPDAPDASCLASRRVIRGTEDTGRPGVS